MSVRGRSYPARVRFSAQEARRIAGGRKVQHRFPRSRAVPDPLAILPVTFSEPAPALGFQENGEPREASVRACYIRVLGIREGTLGDATDQDARAEGWRSRVELMDAWDWAPGMTPVWVMTFEVDRTDRPRWLSRAVVAGRQGAYVDNPYRALPDEGEAVDDATLERLTAEARERDAMRAARARQALRQAPLAVQVRTYEREARARHIDIRDELRALRRWKQKSAQERQLERIRARLSA